MFVKEHPKLGGEAAVLSPSAHLKKVKIDFLELIHCRQYDLLWFWLFISQQDGVVDETLYLGLYLVQFQRYLLLAASKLLSYCAKSSGSLFKLLIRFGKRPMLPVFWSVDCLFLISTEGSFHTSLLTIYLVLF